jgi:hypothetical protein
LQAEIAKTHLENEAFVKVFGKEHGGFARSKGLGVTEGFKRGFFKKNPLSGIIPMNGS